MKLVYIAHPFTSHGTIAENQQAIDTICRSIVADSPDVVPVSPIHAFGFYDPTGCQDKVIGYCKELLSACSEIWLYGQWRHSKGCRAEAQHAMIQGLLVRDMEKEGDNTL